MLVLPIASVSSVTFSDDAHCPQRHMANRECTCTSTEIKCRFRNLQNVPTFLLSPWPFKRLDLSQNNISIIPARAFENINVTEIDLSENDLRVFDELAFSHLEGQLLKLDLRDNSLSEVPGVLKKLNKLSLLDVSYNPIGENNFTNEVMRQIGDTLIEFRFGDPELRHWPSSLHHFPELQILKFFGGKMDRIPISAFNGFEYTLRKLWMQNTSLIAVPIALQHLHNCDELHFDNNLNVSDAGILIPAFAGMVNSLKTLSLENNQLTTFPPVLRTLRQLANLSLAHNNLQIVSDQAISEVSSNLTTLNLQSCNLDRVPGALSRITHLRNLDFTNNFITTIEKNDFQNMRSLVSLNISHNPVEYISKSTFHDLTSLTEMIINGSKLYEVSLCL